MRTARWLKSRDSRTAEQLVRLQRITTHTAGASRSCTGAWPCEDDIFGTGQGGVRHNLTSTVHLNRSPHGGVDREGHDIGECR
jgi:hypothetical protein